MPVRGFRSARCPRGSSVDQHPVESNAFVFQTLHDQVVHGPEVCFGKRRSPQSILIGHHDKLEVQFMPDEVEIAEHLRIEFQFFEGIQLIVYGRFDDKCSVAVDE